MIGITIALLCVAFAAYAAMATLLFHYEKSVFSLLSEQFWNPKKSWKNKWKIPDEKEKFPGSTTIFVFVTDGYHLMQFIFLNCLFVAIAINVDQFAWYWKYAAIRIFYSLFFESTYRILSNGKNLFIALRSRIQACSALSWLHKKGKHKGKS